MPGGAEAGFVQLGAGVALGTSQQPTGSGQSWDLHSSGGEGG